MPTRVKICGCMTVADVKLAVDAGADAVGFIFAESPRMVGINEVAEIAKSISGSVAIVGVVSEPTLEAMMMMRTTIPRLIFQFHGAETPSFCRDASMGACYIKVFHIKSGFVYSPEEFAELLEAYQGAMPMFDSKIGEKLGGTGVPFSWDVLKKLMKPSYIISGGLTPQNVGECVRLLRPYAVDVRSGVETDGKKDPEKIRAFIAAVREADASA